MKKFVIIIAATMLGAGSLFAQDLASATEAYNNGITANEAGNVEMALQSFNEALALAEAIGAEGAEIAEGCKSSIPILQFALAKKAVNEADYGKAINGLNETIAVANKYGKVDIADEAAALIPQVLMQKANGFFQSKNYAEAAAAYNDVLAADATNGMAALRLGAALKGAGDKAGAVDAFKKAAELGQEKSAFKQLSTFYQQEAAIALKAKKYDDAIAAALESNNYVESAKAFQIAGTAASNSGKNKQAIEYFEKYLQLAPTASNITEIAFNLAVNYHKVGNKEKAKEYYQKAVTDPRFGAQAQQQLAALK